MEAPEELVNKVLTGLCGAATPAGFEARILNTVQARLRRPASSHWRGCLHRWAPASVRAATAAAAAVTVCATSFVALVGVSLHTRHADIPTKRIDAAAQAQLSDHPGIPVHATSSGQSIPYPLTGQLRRPPIRTHKQTTETIVLAANRPAPPLPLTGQEKLLIEVAHQQNRAALLLLSQDAQSEQLARADEQFQKFFAPPPAIPTPEKNKDTTAGPGGAL